MNINIDRPMVTIFFEIKRNLPFESRDAMKISAPDIGERLLDIHRASNNPSLKTLIEKFFARAGDDWTHRINPPKKSLLTSFYRQAV